MIIPDVLGLCLCPVYLLSADYMRVVIGFRLQGACAGAMYSQNPSFLTERFPTEVRATAAAFCCHQGAIFAGTVGPVIAWFATTGGMGFAKPTQADVHRRQRGQPRAALLCGRETLGKEVVADLEIAAMGEIP
jgi:SHS family lactate transporter-like MFS transporter